ncbi:nucleotide excision repair endonuclease [uncultured Clostridium sp.]|jgi:excinuclease UvrABC nuclease subunit|uniref:nucleotide excision repair endonuclease n=1 Tax=uncultured Clostridium sp. TaxID=59620 RepID=UPI002607F072|nr:nucleotide excision repair endonuclease [uncultured Clostridium sp.]
MLGIYRFKNLKGEIIYIGKSKNLKLRWKQHFSIEGHLPKTCYSETVIIEFIKFENKTDMDIYELYLINKHNPKYNFQRKNNEKMISIILPELNWEVYNPDIAVLELPKRFDDYAITKTCTLFTEKEFDEIMYILHNGIKFINQHKRKQHIKPNKQIALILSIQATLGFKLWMGYNKLNIKYSDMI